LSVDVKICGLSDPKSVSAAVEGGAKFIGFVFCAKSRHGVDPNIVTQLIEAVPASVETVGLFVDPTDEDLMHTLAKAPLTMVQLHGSETPERVSAVKNLTKRPIIKAIGISSPLDIERAHAYEAVSDYLLMDAKPPQNGPTGGNGVPFDWDLLKNSSFTRPWLLAGGLNLDNMERAVASTGTKILDVSSGVEDAIGHKSPEKIRAFLAQARILKPVVNTSQ